MPAASPPGDLALVERFVNTANLEDGSDAIADAPSLSRWLREQGLAGSRDAFTARDVGRLVAFREALRALLLSHNEEPLDRDALGALDAAAAAAPLTVAFTGDGSISLAPAGEGAGAVVARLLAIVALAEADGSWARMKACPAEHCGWAFYDHSRNRSRTWCDMAICGNRAKARSYRSRTRGDR